MTRWIMITIVLGAAACGGPVDRAPAESLASVTQAVEGCRSYDGYTAALAEATIDCLGAISPNDYSVDANGGLLVPTFESCPNEERNPPPQEPPREPAMVRIKRLLSLQLGHIDSEQRSSAPLARLCIRDAYLSAQKTLIGSGNTVCPAWHKVFDLGNPRRTAKRMAQQLPRPHAVFDPATGEQKFGIDRAKDLGPGFRIPKEYFAYTVDFAGTPEPPREPCGRAENCARVCSSLFEGFYVARFGKYIVGDPYWWLDPSDYGFDPNDPYNRVNGFYHAMSLTGDKPGQLYGDYNRAYNVPGAPDDGNAEECLRWDGSNDVMGILVQDQLLPDDTTWLSRCDPFPAVTKFP
jgi:hypothetical protein